MLKKQTREPAVQTVIVQVAGPPGGMSDHACRRVEDVIATHHLDAVVERITDFDGIITCGVYAVPGISVDGVIRSVGRVPDEDEIFRWLSKVVLR